MYKCNEHEACESNVLTCELVTQIWQGLDTYTMCDDGLARGLFLELSIMMSDFNNDIYMNTVWISLKIFLLIRNLDPHLFSSGIQVKFFILIRA